MVLVRPSGAEHPLLSWFSPSPPCPDLPSTPGGAAGAPREADHTPATPRPCCTPSSGTGTGGTEAPRTHPVSTQPSRWCSVLAPPSWHRKSHSSAGGGRQQASLARRYFTSPRPCFPSSRRSWGAPHRRHHPHPCHTGLSVSLGQVQPHQEGQADTTDSPRAARKHPGARRGQGWQGKQAGRALAVPGATLHQPRRALPCRALPPSPPKAGDTVPTSSLWALPALRSPGLGQTSCCHCACLPRGSRARRSRAAQGSPESRLSHSVLHLASPLPAPPPASLAVPALPRPHQPRCSRPCTRGRRPGQSRLPVSPPSPPGLGRIKLRRRELLLAHLETAEQRARPWACSASHDGERVLRRGVGRGFTPCPVRRAAQAGAELPGKVNYWRSPQRAGGQVIDCA